MVVLGNTLDATPHRDPVDCAPVSYPDCSIHDDLSLMSYS